MWFTKTLFTFQDGYILVGHPTGGSYGQFYYYIMSSSLACKKTHEIRETHTLVRISSDPQKISRYVRYNVNNHCGRTLYLKQLEASLEYFLLEPFDFLNLLYCLSLANEMAPATAGCRTQVVSNS